MAAYPTINLNDSVPAAPADAIAVKWQSAVSSHDADILNVSGAVQGDGDTTHFLRGDGTFATPPSGFSNPMTTEGDIIIENATPAPDRLPIGTTGEVLTVVSGLPAWQAPAGASTPFQSLTTTSGNTSAKGVVWVNNLGCTCSIPSGAANGDRVTICFNSSVYQVYPSGSANGPWTFNFAIDNQISTAGSLVFNAAAMVTNGYIAYAELVWTPNGWNVLDYSGATLTT